MTDELKGSAEERMEPMRMKTILTAAIILSGAVFTFVLGTGGSAQAFQSSGIAIDFGERNVVWTDVDLKANGDPLDALRAACGENDFTYDIGPDGSVSEINGVSGTSERKWGLWAVEGGSLEWNRLGEPYGSIAKYSVASWAYCAENERPAAGVDQYGTCIYGYAQANRVVTLSPSLTEIVGSLNAVSALVGTDKYSNYPDTVTEAQARGDIAIVGDFLSPSYELIMKADPDVVFCDGSQYTHYEMALKLRKAGVNAIVMYGGESTDTILDNIYIMGTVMRYGLRALDVISSLEYAVTEIAAAYESIPVRTMIALSPDKAPWVSGSYTYIGDILSDASGENVFSSRYGWVQVNSELVARSRPSVILIITEDYAATQSEYDSMIGSLSLEWRSTEAYSGGQIYMICEDAADMASRAGPRFAQLTETVARIVHNDASGTFPKFIGSGYEELLTFTENLGFN